MTIFLGLKWHLIISLQTRKLFLLLRELQLLCTLNKMMEHKMAEPREREERSQEEKLNTAKSIEMFFNQFYISFCEGKSLNFLNLVEA